jgi:hypothetical protein
MNVVTLEERLAHGNISMSELRQLAGVSNTSLYADVRAGKLAYQKRGKSTRVPGPIAKRYINGEPIDDLIPLYPELKIGRQRPVSTRAREAES